MQAFALKRGSVCVSVVLAADIADAASKADDSITEIAVIGTGHAELTDAVLEEVLEVAGVVLGVGNS